MSTIISKLCKFHFKKGKVEGGYCKNKKCKFNHPDTPQDIKDDLWCKNDLEPGGCVDTLCYLYNPNSMFVKIEKNGERQHDLRVGLNSKFKVLTSRLKRKIKTEKPERSSKRVKTESFALKTDKQYILLDDFSKDDLYYHHEDKINGKRGQQITVIGQCCDSYHGHDDCEFVEVRNQFDETGFIHVSIVGEEEKKLSCFMSPKCKDLAFETETEYHNHLCLEHFYEEFVSHLEDAQICPIPTCGLKFGKEEVDKVLHYGSVPHAKVVSLAHRNLQKAVQTFQEQYQAKIQELKLKSDLIKKDCLKIKTESSDTEAETKNADFVKEREIMETKRKILEKECNKITAERDVLESKMAILEKEKQKLIEERDAIEMERDNLDGEKVDFIDNLHQLMKDRNWSKCKDLPEAFKSIERVETEQEKLIKNSEKEIQKLSQYQAEFFDGLHILTKKESNPNDLKEALYIIQTLKCKDELEIQRLKDEVKKVSLQLSSTTEQNETFRKNHKLMIEKERQKHKEQIEEKRQEFRKMKENLQNTFQSVEVEKLKVTIKSLKENNEYLKKEQKFLIDKESLRVKEDFEKKTYEIRRKLDEKEKELKEQESKAQILIENSRTLVQEGEKESKRLINDFEQKRINYEIEFELLKKKLIEADLTKIDLEKKISNKTKTIANLLIERCKDKEDLDNFPKQRIELLELKEQNEKLQQDKQALKITSETLEKNLLNEKNNYSRELKSQTELYYHLMKEMKKKDRVIEKFLPLINEFMKTQNL